MNDVKVKYNNTLHIYGINLFKSVYNIYWFKYRIKKLFKYIGKHYLEIADCNEFIKENLVDIYNHMLPTTKSDIVFSYSISFPFVESSFNHRLMNKDFNKILNCMIIQTNNPDIIDEDQYRVYIEKQIRTGVPFPEYLLLVLVGKK